MPCANCDGPLGNVIPGDDGEAFCCIHCADEHERLGCPREGSGFEGRGKPRRGETETVKAMKRARDVAIRMTIEARIPECGYFSAIAQDLDALCSEVIPESDIAWHAGYEAGARQQAGYSAGYAQAERDIMAMVDRFIGNAARTSLTDAESRGRGQAFQIVLDCICAAEHSDSDGSPKGGDGEAGSVHDSAGPQDIAKDPPA